MGKNQLHSLPNTPTHVIIHRVETQPKAVVKDQLNPWSAFVTSRRHVPPFTSSQWWLGKIPQISLPRTDPWRLYKGKYIGVV